MNFTIDFNLVMQALLVGGLMHTARTMWKTSGVVERLDERTTQHGQRIERLEERVDAA